MMDYQDEASLDMGWEEVMAETGGNLDALFNNGAFSMRGAVEDVPTQALREIADTRPTCQRWKGRAFACTRRCPLSSPPR